MGDILNCKNKFSRHKFNTPLTSENYAQQQTHAKYFEEYINTLQDANGIPILQSGKKTGFLGLIVCLRNISRIYHHILKLANVLVCNKLYNIINCEICKNQLVGEKMPLLSKIKNKRPYLKSSDDVCIICKVSESTIRQYMNELKKNNIKQFLINTILRRLSSPFSNNTMQDHILTQEIFDNHRTQLCKHIVSLYIDVRLFYEAKNMSSKDDYICQKYTKLILFSHQ
ncbi:hypothetical protein ALC62_09628 [Cyphomyrmex costatus]|uniref:THAP domain-containing protein 9 n=1 Tax=Cyphomyrmex costatus TaxID=456900 RepID=A0A151IFF2_9HYME|nr:hypothetical protein ALC62_09628 [Cyphomyrmex costatus]